MKKIKIYLSFLAVFALLFTSCSKEENPGMNDDSGKATLSFGAIVQDLANNSTNKQSDFGDYPECTDDAPAYVHIVLMQGGTAVVGSLASPYRVDLVAGQIFTEEDAALELEPGNYTLDHFSVYNTAGDLIWLAPKGGQLAQLVDYPLPLSIDLGAGVKKYVDVSVICYDDRDVNEYGYLFFELDANEAFEFCFFANYCTPEGRHYPARYSVNISIDGTSIYNGVVNTTGRDDNGDLYADPLCFALPNLSAYEDDEEYIDYTLTLLDWTEHDDAYGDVDQMVISGSLSRAEIMANFAGSDDVEYEHVRFGCGEDDGGNGGVVDSDEDGVPDSIDECPDTNSGVEVDEKGCPVTQETDTDNDGVVDSIDQCPNTPAGVTVDAVGCPIDTDGDGVPNYLDNCPNTANPDQTDSDSDGRGDVCDDPNEVVCEISAPDTGCTVVYSSGVETWIEITQPDGFPDPLFLTQLGETNNFGSLSVLVVEGDLVVQLNMDEGVSLDDYVVDISDDNDGTVDVCEADSDIAPPTGDDPDATVIFANTTVSYPFYIRVKANVCTQ